MLKKYKVNGKQFKYEEGEQPEGAIEVKAKKAPAAEEVEPPVKAKKPANKARKAVRTK